MNKPDISIIVPIFNAEKYLQKSIDSLLYQEEVDLEIILVNDGSTDNSKKIINNYKKYKNIKIINQEHSNAGVARNKGLKIAKGEYIAFLDADDYFQKKAFTNILKELEKEKNVDVTIFGAQCYNEASERTTLIKDSITIKNCPLKNPFSPEDMNKYLFNSFQFWAWNKIYKREMILKNKIEFQDVERSNDAKFVASSLLHAKKIKVLNKYLIVHRIGHGTNTQANNVEKPLEFWKAYKEVKKEVEKIEKDDYSMFEQSLLNKLLIGIIDYLDSVKSNPIVYDKVKMHIKKNGEIDFAFLNKPKEYYYNTKYYKKYRNIIENKAEENHNKIVWFYEKTRNAIKSIIENGINYTYRRALFHLRLVPDNDPSRTKATRKIKQQQTKAKKHALKSIKINEKSKTEIM